MITVASLNAKSLRDLGTLANRFGIEGWRSMRKESLVKAIMRATQRRAQPAKHAPAKHAPAKHAPAKHAAAKHAAAKHAAVKYAAAKPVLAKPAAAKSVPAKLAPAAAKPAPAAGKPALAKSAKKDNSKGLAVTSKSTQAAAKVKPHAVANGRKPVKSKASPRVQARIQMARAVRERQKNLSSPSESHNGEVKILSVNGNANGSHRSEPKPPTKKDRIVLLVRDAYWLQAVWELTRQSVERAQVALGQQWHAAKPVLRLIELESGNTTSSVEQVARSVPIHGKVNTWFIDVQDSPKTFRVDIGYTTAGGKFFSLARSNSVSTPRPGLGDGLENNWSDIATDCEKIYALSGGFSDEASNGELQEAFEERLGRPMGGPAGTRYGVGADKVFGRRNEFEFDVDAEMIIFGRTRSSARVTLAGNPVKLRGDGTFAARLAMPDRRQVLPIVASSADGVEQRTVVIAVERNTKVMEPMVRESSE